MADKKRILICDDEEGVRESLKLILEDDYDLVFAASGNDAIEKVRKTPVDLAILDIKMPRMSGIEVLRSLKKILPSMKAIIASGYQSAEAAHESVKYGAGDYIVKPFDSKEVLRKVKAIL
jgi:YesN/AraC family two-component response regulator